MVVELISAPELELELEIPVDELTNCSLELSAPDDKLMPLLELTTL
jgi:hypothetical protein